jgi:hypothetical protein
VRFLVAPPGELREVTGVEEAFALEGSAASASTGARAPLRRVPPRRRPAGRSWRSATAARRRSNAPTGAGDDSFEVDVEALV